LEDLAHPVVAADDVAEGVPLSDLPGEVADLLLQLDLVKGAFRREAHLPLLEGLDDVVGRPLPDGRHGGVGRLLDAAHQQEVNLSNRTGMSFVGCNIGRNGVLVNGPDPGRAAIARQRPLLARLRSNGSLSIAPGPPSGATSRPAKRARGSTQEGLLCGCRAA